MKYCALFVESGFEKSIAAEFGGHLPVIDVLKKIRHRKSKKPVWVSVPLFGNYVFVDSVDIGNILAAMNNVHVFSVVKMGGNYATIDESELLPNKIDESELKIGDTVQVTKGTTLITGEYMGKGVVKVFFFDREILVSLNEKKSDTRSPRA